MSTPTLDFRTRDNLVQNILRRAKQVADKIPPDFVGLHDASLIEVDYHLEALVTAFDRRAGAHTAQLCWDDDGRRYRDFYEALNAFNEAAHEQTRTGYWLMLANDDYKQGFAEECIRIRGAISRRYEGVS